MTRRAFLHIGLPKTGTSYLQSIVWAHRPELAAAGLLVPGRERRDHLWASLAVRRDPRLERRDPRAPGAWQLLLEETAAGSGDVLISHEFFCSASPRQARRTVDELEAAGMDEVHLVVTARDPLSLFTSSWQEHLKNKGTSPIEDYATTASRDPLVVWNWRALDLRLVLGRWGPATEPGRVHVITPPDRDQPREELWRRFCSVLGVPPDLVRADQSFANSSMGVVEAETLRRINIRLRDSERGPNRAYDRGVWIRSYLADERLVPRGGEPFWPGPERVADCRRRGRRAVRALRESGYDVVGDPATLLVPKQIPPRRHPDSVTDAEVAEVAVDLAADLLAGVREASLAAAAPHAPVGRLRRLARLMLRGS